MRQYSSSFLPVSIFFLFISILLWWFRAPNVDEPWMGGIAIALERYGAFYDLGHMRAGQWRLFFFGESYYLCLFFWMKIFGDSLIFARLMSLVLGLGSLFLIFKILKDKISSTTLQLTLFLIAGNYFFLLANTQIRSETWCVFTVFLSIYQFNKWFENSKSIHLFLAHSSLILSTLGHFQAAFVGLLAWILTITIFLRKKESNFVAFLSPYFITAILYFSYLFLNFEQFQNWFAFYFGSEGDMAGHSGGMLTSAITRLKSGETLEFLIIIGLVASIGIGSLVALIQHIKNNLFSSITFLATGAFLSWLLTTTHVNDYHAVWLIFPILSILLINPKNIVLKIIKFGNILLFILFCGWGIYWGFDVVKNNPRADFIHDVKFIKKMQENGKKTIHCPRELMWHFDFDEAFFLPKNYTNKQADMIIRDKFTNIQNIENYTRHDGKRFIIFVRD